MNRRGFLALLGLSPLAALAPSRVVVGIDGGAGDDYTAIAARGLPFSVRAADLEFIASRTFDPCEIARIFSCQPGDMGLFVNNARRLL